MCTLFLFQQPSLVDQLNPLLKARDVPALQRFADTPKDAKIMQLVKTGGGFGGGKNGWNAKLLQVKDHTYVVFSTQIVAEDIGELLFSATPDHKLKYVDERDSFGERITHHTFDVSFDLAEQKAKITDVIKCKRTGSCPYFFVRLSPTFTVTSVTGHANIPVKFSQAGGVVCVENPTENCYTLSYTGTVEKPGFKLQISKDEAVLSGACWYPSIARQPATYEITLHSPKDWIAIAQGEEVSTQTNGDEKVTRFRMDLPVASFSAGAGPYKRAVNTIHGRKYQSLAVHATQHQLEAQNILNSKVIEFYSRQFGAYPFSTWTTVISPQFTGGLGALEAYSFATYGDDFALPFTDAHEPSHTWWGGIINNDYLRSLWNESFADFSMVHFDRHRSDRNCVVRDHIFRAAVRYDPTMDAAPIATAGNLQGPTGPTIGYLKAMHVMQILEDQLGYETMTKAMQEWVRSAPRGEIGKWEDFEAVVNRLTHKNWSWFFDDWIRRAATPTPRLTRATWTNGSLKGTLELKGPFFRMLAADVLLVMRDKTQMERRVKLIRKGNKYVFNCRIAQKPWSVSFDPWQKIPRTNGAQEQPTSLYPLLAQAKRFWDPEHKQYLAGFTTGPVSTAVPSVLANAMVIGSPETLPVLKRLCDQVGFKVIGNTLTYRGVNYDLRNTGAVALADLPGGEHCLIGIGTCITLPNTGKARTIVFDRYGECLDGYAEPVTQGVLARTVQ